MSLAERHTQIENMYLIYSSTMFLYHFVHVLLMADRKFTSFQHALPILT